MILILEELDKEEVKIYITGSSAKSLSKEIATSLRGRCLTYEVFPLDFPEYLHYRGIDKKTNITKKEEALIKYHLKIYLKFGGFAEVLDLEESLLKKIIQTYVNTAVFRDVIDRYEIKHPHIVKLFLIHCLQNIS